MRGFGPVVGGVLTLIALQVFLSSKGPDAAGSMLGWARTGMDKLISPKVAAVPRTGKTKKAAAPQPAPAPGNPAQGIPELGPLGLGTNPTVTT
jgi:hypothetical protein